MVGAAGMHEHRATIGGAPMRWFDSGGEGPTVLLLHGIPTSPLLWRNVVPQLEAARALAWEMVGYGGSWAAGEGRDISVRAQASYLGAWLEDQNIGEVILVGHDLGGGVAQIAAVEEQARFAGIVLINSIAYDSWPIPSVKAMRAMGGAVARTPPSLFRGIFSSFLRRGHDNHDVATESIRTHWRHYDRPQGPASFVAQVRSLDVNDTLSVAAKLSELRLPARVVWGAADPFQKLSYGKRLAGDLSAELNAVDGARHFVPEDHPDQIAGSVRSVIKEARR